MTDPMELVGRLESNSKQTITRYYGDLDGAIVPHALLTEAAACIREMVEIVAGFVSAEDDAKSNPMGGLSLGGLMDGRDNSGCVYQSASLAALIERARALPLPPAPGAEDE